MHKSLIIPKTMKRLFFALYPDPQTRQSCVDVQALLAGSGYKPVPPDNLHVTLVFLGNIGPGTESALLDAAAEITVPAIEVVFDGLAFWQKPQVICLTASTVAPELIGLVGQLSQIAGGQGISLDSRPYQAHVSLARKAKQAAPLEFAPITWRARSFCLVESCSGPEGAMYRVLHTWGEP